MKRCLQRHGLPAQWTLLGVTISYMTRQPDIDTTQVKRVTV